MQDREWRPSGTMGTGRKAVTLPATGRVEPCVARRSRVNCRSRKKEGIRGPIRQRRDGRRPHQDANVCRTWCGKIELDGGRDGPLDGEPATAKAGIGNRPERRPDGLWRASDGFDVYSNAHDRCGLPPAVRRRMSAGPAADNDDYVRSSITTPFRRCVDHKPDRPTRRILINMSSRGSRVLGQVVAFA